MPEKIIPDIVVGRLPRYLQALELMHKAGILSTSSQELGDAIGISAAQIRKDLSLFGEFGKQGKGYSVPYLVEQIRQILKVNQVWDMALVGAGNLGHAIANYREFLTHGFRIVMVFDSDPRVIGRTIGDFIIQNSTDMEAAISAQGVQVAMITVPAGEAQTVADSLVKAGVKAILNYAPITLAVPDGVHVQNIDPIIFLQRMTYYLE